MGAKVLVIGADAADPDLIDRWSAAGDLPNLAALARRAARGRVANPIGLEAGSCWPSFHTGLNPGRQPQFDGLRHFRPEDYAYAHYSREAAPPNFWRELSRAGKRVFVFDPPYAHLDPEINGVFIVDWGTHVPVRGTGRLELTTWPSAVKDDVLRLVGSDPLDGLMCDNNLCETIDEYRRFTAKHVERIEKKGALSAHYLAEEEWDYFEVVFCDLHCMGHHLWHINDPEHPSYRADFEAALGEPLRDGYRALDRAVGLILAEADAHTTVLFYASHGMGPQYTGSGLLDRILERLESGTPAQGRTLKGRLRQLWHAVPAEMRNKLKPLRRPFQGALLHPLFLPNPEDRKLFEVYNNNGAGGIRVNLVGREAKGRVPRSEYAALLDETARDLLEIVNDETGDKLITHVVKTYEDYEGGHLDALPDLMPIWNRERPIRRVHSPKIGTLFHDYNDARTGDHNLEGLFLAIGPGIRPTRLNTPVASVDFLPSLRLLLDLPEAPSDGRPIRVLAGDKGCAQQGVPMHTRS